MKFYLLLVIAFVQTICSHAQSCDFSPADCPVDDYVNRNLHDDSIQELLNPVLPQEIAMENRLRKITDSMAGRFAAKNHWRMIKLEEIASSGYLDEKDSTLEYDKRPPHFFSITYEFIVNEDSLNAWKQWLMGFANRRLANAQKQESAVSSHQDVLQQNQDSAVYYGTLMGQYAAAHAQDLTLNNKQAMEAYQKKMDYYQKKINGFTSNITQVTDSKQSQQAESNFENERTEGTVRFSDASVLQVQFSFNLDVAGTAGKPIPLSGQNDVKWFYNDHPDLQDALNRCNHSKNNALLLLGAWNQTPDADHNYRATFDGSTRTIKKIKSDRVQTIAVRAYFNKVAMAKFLSGINAAALKALIISN